MIRTLTVLSLFILVLNANVIKYYKIIVDTLQYDKTYSLYKQVNDIFKESVRYNRYTNFSLDATYSSTKAKILNSAFNTTDVAINDTLDLFGKGSYRVEELSLNLKARKSSLNLQKEQLFITLINMLCSYHRLDKQLALHKQLLRELELIYNKLQKLQHSGAIASIDLLRFKNILTPLKIKIISEVSQLSKMKKQLHLYAPNQDIATLDDTKILYDKEDFLTHHPSSQLNEIDAQILHTQAKSMSHIYLPDIRAGMTYQQLGDPTAYGDNYSFNIALHMPLNGGDFKQAEALNAKALAQKSKAIQYKINRDNQYTQLYEDYQNAQQQLIVLRKSLKDYNKSEDTIKKAFLQQYVDFNTYLQVLTQALNIKEQIITMEYQKRSKAAIINSIASGKIYE